VIHHALGDVPALAAEDLHHLPSGDPIDDAANGSGAAGAARYLGDHRKERAQGEPVPALNHEP
jgi:hypothetical protein